MNYNTHIYIVNGNLLLLQMEKAQIKKVLANAYAI